MRAHTHFLIARAHRTSNSSKHLLACEIDILGTVSSIFYQHIENEWLLLGCSSIDSAIFIYQYFMDIASTNDVLRAREGHPPCFVCGDKI